MRSADLLRLFGLSAIWGASFLFMRLIVPVIGVLPTSFFRVFLSSLGLLVIFIAMRFPLQFKGKFKILLVLGTVSSGIPVLMYNFAALYLPAGYSAIFNATTPLMGIIVGALFFSEKLTRVKFVGVLFGLAGVAVLTRTGPATLDGQILLGAAACLVATTCYGLAGFLTKRWISDTGGLDSRLVALGSQLGATALTFPAFVIGEVIHPTANWGGIGVWASLGALGLVCTALAYVIFFRLIADIGPVRSLTVTFLIPPFGVMWGAIFLGEQITLAHLAGGALIAIALALVLLPHKK